MKKYFFIFVFILASQLCSAYSISSSGHTITVKMYHPSVGLVGLNAVGWSDDPERIGEDIYDLFVGFFDSYKSGIYTVNIYWKVTNRYGKEELQYAGSYSFSAEEIRKYKNYSF